MMISPESFVEMGLQGKTREDAVKEVKSLLREINRLKRILENDPYLEECMIKPGPQVKISVSRKHLTAAREFFKKQGWEYDMSKAEIKDMEFNDRINDIESINIEYGGFHCERESRKIKLDGMTRNYLLRELYDLHMGEWKRNYTDPCIQDGIQWEVEIIYTDGKKRVFSGSNAYPYNFKKFLDVVQMDAIVDL